MDQQVIYKKVNRWRSAKVCPNCSSRATKIMNLSSEIGLYECQICGHEYNPPPQKNKRG
jgi:Zn ribbon nucleic-acid-binding protein